MKIKLLGKFGVNMKKAIVFGATGYIGSNLVDFLLKKDVCVLAISRTKLIETKERCIYREKEQLKEVNLDVDLLFSSSVINDITSFCNNDDVIVYNTIWKGALKLRDGDLVAQFKNIERCTKVLEYIAKQGCSKYIHISTQDEALYKNYIDNKYWKSYSFSENDLPYSSAKLAAKEMSEVIAYFNKVDFISTRFSAVLDFSLSSKSFITNNLKKIISDNSFDNPSSSSPIELVSLYDLLNAYYFIGKYGKNKADYYIGQGEYHTLVSWFKAFYNYKNNGNSCVLKESLDNSFVSLFNNESLLLDTGFEFKYNYKDIFEEILKCNKQ